MPGNFFKNLFKPKSAPLPPPIADAPYPYELVPGQDAVTRLMAARMTEGKVSVLAGAPELFPRVFELLEHCEESTEEIVHQGLALDVDQWLQEQRSESTEDYAGFEQAMEEKTDLKPDDTSLTALTVPYKSGNTPLPWVVLLHIPAPMSWQAPAFLAYGGWNDCPEPAVHVAMFKRWKEQYGAEVACITLDVLEFTVARPPQTLEEAQRLAMEQFIYCPDIVLQGAGNIDYLAQMLLGRKFWYFWWD